MVSDGIIDNAIEVEGPFVWTQEKLDSEIRVGTTINLSSKFGFNVLRSDQSEKIKRPSTLIDSKVGVGTNEDAYQEALELFNAEGIMSYPKPTSLIRYLINTVTYFDQNAVVLDFFAGSSTTAHAVMQLNAEDGGNRKFIMVQLPEPCNEQSEAFKAGYNTIAEISKERIRRAGKKILEGEFHNNWNKDSGFRVLKIDSSNMAKVYYTPDAVKQEELFNAVDNIKPDRTPEDLLFQVLLDLSVDLSLPIRKELIQGKSVFFVNHSPYDLIACFDTGVSEELVEELAQHKPLRVVFRDTGFTTDTVKINVDQIFKQLSPGTEVKSI